MAWFRRSPPPPTIAELTAPIVAQLDAYHKLWADHNRSVLADLDALKARSGDTVLLEQRLQALEHDRNMLRIDVEEGLEKIGSLYNRLRMRHTRELGAGEPDADDQASIALLKRKGVS